MTVSLRTLRDVTDRDIAGLCDVLIDCVEGGASVSFMLPMTRERAETFWRDAVASVTRGGRTIVVAEDDGGIVGTASLITALPENQPHRGDVAKMLVHRRARDRGIGMALLQAVEREAAQQGKTLLVLDTVPGAAGERLYVRNGWQRIGEVPNYALWPDGRPCPTAFYYKQL